LPGFDHGRRITLTQRSAGAPLPHPPRLRRDKCSGRNNPGLASVANLVTRPNLCLLEVQLASLFKNVTLTESNRLNGPPFATHPRV